MIQLVVTVINEEIIKRGGFVGSGHICFECLHSTLTYDGVGKKRYRTGVRFRFPVSIDPV